jgi:hypothetical protein
MTIFYRHFIGIKYALTSGDSLLYEIDWGKVCPFKFGNSCLCLLIIWEGVVLPETALSHKRILHPKPPINFDGEKKIEWGNMTRSCKKCGFFVSSPTSSTKDIGYCLFVGPRDIIKKELLL